MRLLSILTLLLSTTGIAQLELLNENFSGGIPATWAIVDDGNTPNDAVSQFTEAWIYYESEDDSSAASTSYFEPIDTASRWLITPKISLMTFSKLIWESRSVDASYPDGYVVLISNTDSLTGSFTDTLAVVDAANPVWEKFGVLLDTAGYANEDVYIAFVNNTYDGFILELDDIKILSDDNASIKEVKQEYLDVYPNPVNETLNVKYQLNQGEFFSLFDMRGMEVVRSYSNSIDVSFLPSGIYTIRSLTDKGLLHQKFIIE